MGRKNEKLKGPKAKSAYKVPYAQYDQYQPIIGTATMHLDDVSPAPEVVNKPGDHGVRQCPVRPSSASRDLLLICWEMIVNYSHTL